MRQSGEIIEWNDDRGFGFVRPDGTRERLFVHIKSIRRIVNRPQVGDRLEFALGSGRDGRAAAIDAAIIGANPVDRSANLRGLPLSPPTTPIHIAVRLAAAALLLAAMLLVMSIGRAPGWLVWLYLGAGLVSAVAYARDKRAAESGGWRTKESTLLSLDLVGGIIGGLLAQVAFRHKSSKLEYGVATAAIVVIHLVALVLLGTGFLTWP